MRFDLESRESTRKAWRKQVRSREKEGAAAGAECVLCVYFYLESDMESESESDRDRDDRDMGRERTSNLARHKRQAGLQRASKVERGKRRAEKRGNSIFAKMGDLVVESSGCPNFRNINLLDLMSRFNASEVPIWEVNDAWDHGPWYELVDSQRFSK